MFDNIEKKDYETDFTVKNTAKAVAWTMVIAGAYTFVMIGAAKLLK